MWTAFHLESLSSLRATLVKVGPSTQLERMSLMDENIDEWDASYAVEIMADISRTLDILEEGGFFSFLGQLPGLRRELMNVLAWTCCHCKDSRTPELIDVTLPPIFRQLGFLDPIKVYNILWHLNGILQEEEEEEVDNWLEHLRRIQEDLEEVQPRRILDTLQDLHQLLTSRQEHLKLLVPLGGIMKKLGSPNLFDELLSVWHTLDFMLKDYCSGLSELQDFLEMLSQIQAVVPSSGDWEE